MRAQRPAHEYPPGRCSPQPAGAVGRQRPWTTNEGRVMTQAGRQGSPRNSSGRNSAGQRGQGAARRRAPAAAHRAAQAAAAEPTTRAEAAAGEQATRAAATAPSSTPSPAKRPSSIRTCRDPTARRRQAAASGDWKSKAPSGKEAARKAAARKPGFGKAPGTPGALKPKPRIGAGAAKATGSRAFGSERFGQSLGPVRKPARKRGPAPRCPSPTCTTRTASACRRSWPPQASPHGASARK